MIKDQIYLIMKNSIEYALLIVHGIPSIIKGLSYYAIKYDFLITENNYEYFKYLSIFLTILLLASIFFYNFKFGRKKHALKLKRFCFYSIFMNSSQCKNF